jgi:predicted GNAT family acetyltransferase
MSLEVQHNPQSHQFYIAFVSGEGEVEEQAILKYQMLDDKSVDFYSTFVPTSLRGKGVAAKLVEAGFQWAQSQGLEIHTSCSYAEAYAQRKLNH